MIKKRDLGQRLHALATEHGAEVVDNLRITAQAGFRFLPQRFTYRKIEDSEYLYYRAPIEGSRKYKRLYIGEKGSVLAFFGSLDNADDQLDDPRQLKLLKTM